MKELIKLFWAFVKIGTFTFGGGYAMLPLLQKEIVEKNNWASDQELMDYFAIGQCTPGVIAVNTATFIGYKKDKLKGAIVATLGLLIPSIVIITVIAAFLANFSDLAVVGYAFSGIRSCVCVLIFDAVLKMVKKSVFDVATWVIFTLVALLSFESIVSSVVLVILAGAIGVLIEYIKDRSRV